MNTVDSIMALADKYSRHDMEPLRSQARAALRHALQEFAAEKVGKPVGYFYQDKGWWRQAGDPCFKAAHTPLYAAPQPAQPVAQPLTDEQIEVAYRELYRNEAFGRTTYELVEAGIRFAEKHHGIGAKE